MNNSEIKIMLLIICVLIVLGVLKSINSPMSRIVTLAASLSVFFGVISNLNPIVDFILSLSKKANIDYSHIKIILKCIGISIIGEYTVQLCKDNGESALSSGAELICKTSILLISLPMYTDILNMILKLWEN